MMKNILLCVSLYIMLSAMIVATFLLPGSLQRDESPFFRDFSTLMITLGSLWMIKSTIYVLLAPWYTYIWTKRKHRFVQRNYRPLVSVIIPAWNEEVGLVATIKTILASTYHPLEVVVVNDGSTDRSDEITREFIQKYQTYVAGSDNYASIIYHYQPNGGKGAALNTGISLSHGEIILTFDADSIIHEHAVKHFVSYFADPSVMAAAGNIRIGNTKTLLGLTQSLEYYFGFQNKKAEALLGIIFVIGGAASAFRREVFHKVGGYYTKTLTEDLDLSLRIQEAGMHIVYAPEAIVHTEGPTTLRGLFKQRLRWKHGRLEAFRMHQSSFFKRKKGSNTFFFWIILPLVIMGDIETALGTAYTILLYFYSFLSHDFSFLLLTISFSTIIFALQFFEDRHFRKFRYLLLAPLTWFFLHFATFVELNSLIQALYAYCRKREIKWQTWKRTGVTNS
jgi:poly-beta-1,6-N-acetyl-D-glucosamine synthase